MHSESFKSVWEIAAKIVSSTTEIKDCFSFVDLMMNRIVESPEL